jgi:hypothetical protein
MISLPASSCCGVIGMTGLGDRHAPENVIVFTGIRTQHVLLDGSPGTLKPEAALRAMGGSLWKIAEIEAAGGRGWLIVALVDNFAWQQEQADYFDAHHIQLDHHNVGGVQIYLYEIPH